MLQILEQRIHLPFLSHLGEPLASASVAFRPLFQLRIDCCGSGDKIRPCGLCSSEPRRCRDLSTGLLSLVQTLPCLLNCCRLLHYAPPFSKALRRAREKLQMEQGVAAHRRYINSLPSSRISNEISGL